MRTIPDISDLLYPLDEAVDCLIKTIFDDHEFSSIERKLWSLPVRMGGLGIPVPSEIAEEQYRNSRTINTKLTTKVRDQQRQYEDIEIEVKKAKNEVRAKKNERYERVLQDITTNLESVDKEKALEAAQEKGASSWLNTLPL